MASLYTLILLSVVGTSLLSGIFGMAGGMILMGIYAATLPVSSAMILHGFTQLSANGLRWYFLREHTDWRALGFYLVGAALAVGVVSSFAFVPSHTALFLFLGLVPLVGAMLPPARALSISSRSGAVLCGALVTGVQLVAGVAGSILDLFFAKSPLSKEAVVATKAVTQTVSHLLKLVYFARLSAELETGIDLPAWLFPVIFGAAWLGTAAGGRILSRMDDRLFRRFSQGLIMAIALVYLARGLQGVWTGEG